MCIFVDGVGMVVYSILQTVWDEKYMKLIPDF
jgi:hypothetical protein